MMHTLHMQVVTVLKIVPKEGQPKCLGTMLQQFPIFDILNLLTILLPVRNEVNQVATAAKSVVKP